MPTESPGSINQVAMKELRDLQSQLFDKSSNYTKLIFGLGYGGFFAFWAGTRQYLQPKQAVRSALLMAISLVLFIAFEVVQAGILSYLAINFSKSSNAPASEMPAALEGFRMTSWRTTKWLYRCWFVVFPASVITGFVGVGILLWGWLRWLYTIK